MTRTRWPRRAVRAFDARLRTHARKLAKRTEAAAPHLAAELDAIRSEFGQAIFDALTSKKAQPRTAQEIIDEVLAESVGEDVDVSALTTAQYLAAKHAIEQMTPDAYGDTIYDDAAALLEIGHATARDYLLLDSSTFDVPPVWATQALREHADDVANLASAYDREKMTSVLDAALLNGASAKTTAKAMKEAFASGFEITDDDGNVTRVMRSDAWFDLTARTELQRASNLGQYSLYTAAGVQSVTWQAAEPCDECAEADGLTLPIGQDFPGVDVDVPPAHPNCRCVLVPSDADLGDFNGTDEEIATARRGGYASDEEAQAQRDRLDALAEKQAARAAKRAAKE